MSSMSTPGGRRRTTQPPLNGPSLSTPHRSPFPTSLRPSLFHAPAPHLSAAYSPVSANSSAATPVALADAARLQAPRNTPSSALSSRTASAPAKNPFERLPASSFDSFVDSVTQRIKSALEPGELPSERRRREREEREKEREEAKREREEARRKKQEEDVFGEIRAWGEEMRGLDRATEDLAGGQLESTDFADRPRHDQAVEPSHRSPRPSSPSSVVYGHMPSDISLSSASVSAAPSIAQQDGDDDILVLSSSAESSTRATPQPEMRELRLGSSHSLFVARATASVSSDDGRDAATRETGRDESFGLETGPEDEQDDRVSQPNRFDEVNDEERQASRNKDAPLVLQEDEFDVDAIGEGVEAEEKAEAAADELEVENRDEVICGTEGYASEEVWAEQSIEADDDIVEDAPYYRDPFGRPFRYAQPTAYDDDESDMIDHAEDRAPSLEDDRQASADTPVDLAPVEVEDNDAAVEAERIDSVDGDLAAHGRDEEDAPEDRMEEEGTSRSPSSPHQSITKTIELGSSSDEESARPTRQPRPPTEDADDRLREVPQCAPYGANAEQPRAPFALDVDIGVEESCLVAASHDDGPGRLPAETLEAVSGLSQLSPRLALTEIRAERGGEEALCVDEEVQEEQEEQIVLPGQQVAERDDGDEFFGEDTPGDEVEQGAEIHEDDQEMEDAQAMGSSNPLEALYADEDSEDIGPSIPYEAKGKGRASSQATDPMDSDEEVSDDGSDSSVATINSENVDLAIAEWMKWSPHIGEYNDDELAERIFTLSAQLELAMDVDSPRQHLIAQQLTDFHSELARRMPSDDEDALLGDQSANADSTDDMPMAEDDEKLGGSSDRSVFQQDSASPEPVDATAAAQIEAKLGAIASNLVNLFDRGVSSAVQVPQDVLGPSIQPSVRTGRTTDDEVEQGRESSPVVEPHVADDALLAKPVPTAEKMLSDKRELVVTPIESVADLTLQPSDAQPSEATSNILASPVRAESATPAGSTVEESPPSAPLRTVQHPAHSSHLREEPGPQPDFASRVRYEMPPTVHRIYGPANSDSSEANTPQDETVRLGVTDEEMLDGSRVGRLVPLSSVDDATVSSHSKQADADLKPSNGGLVIIDDDVETIPIHSPPRTRTPVLLSAAPQILDATPPPRYSLHDGPTIVDGVAPPQNFDIVPAPLSRTPSPIAPTPSTAHQREEASPRAVLDDRPLSAELLTDPPESASNPAVAADSVERVAHVSHKKSKIAPQPTYENRVRYEAPPAVHDVDSPVHNDEAAGGGPANGAVRLGLSDEELQNALLAGSVPPLEMTDAVAERDVLELQDMEFDGEGAPAGLVVIDDDVEEQVEEPVKLSSVVQLDSVVDVDLFDASEGDAWKLDATPPPQNSTESQPPIVIGVAPPQNPALLPTSGPAETHVDDFVAFGETDDDDHDADQLSAADQADHLRAPKSPDGTASHVLGLPGGAETVVVSNSAEASDDSDEEGAINVYAAPRAVGDDAEPAEPQRPGQTVGTVGEVDITQQESTLQPEYAPSHVPSGAKGPIAIKNVVQAGEWDQHDPIEFGDTSSGEIASADVEFALENEQISPSQGASSDLTDMIVDDGFALATAHGSSPLPDLAGPHGIAPSRPGEEGELDEAVDESTDEEQLVISLVGSSRHSGASSEALFGVDHAQRASTSSSTTTAPARQPSSLPGKVPQHLRPSTPLRRSSRLFLPPPPAPSSTSQSTRMMRRSRTVEEPPSSSKSLPSPSRRPRTADPPRSQATVLSSGARVHQHRHRPISATPSSTNGVSPPLTRSRCHFSRLRISSREEPSAPPYLFNVPTCALASDHAQENMRRFHVENLGDVLDSDDCEGIQLGGQTPSDANAAEVMESRHSALVPHEDVLDAVRRIAGSELWDEGACEVLPREEVAGRALRGLKRAATSAPSSDGGQTKKSKP